jgi:hypothetical protein
MKFHQLSCCFSAALFYYTTFLKYVFPACTYIKILLKEFEMIYLIDIPFDFDKIKPSLLCFYA